MLGKSIFSYNTYIYIHKQCSGKTGKWLTVIKGLRIKRGKMCKSIRNMRIIHTIHLNN